MNIIFNYFQVLMEKTILIEMAKCHSRNQRSRVERKEWIPVVFLDLVKKLFISLSS